MSISQEISKSQLSLFKYAPQVDEDSADGVMLRPGTLIYPR